MNNILLLKFIERFRRGDMEAFSVIYNEFKELIRFYSYKVGDEDAYQELTVFLLELLYGIKVLKFASDYSDTVRRYIAVCLKHKYIALSKEKQKIQSIITGLYDSDCLYFDASEGISEVLDLVEGLSLKQRVAIIYRYIYGYSDEEISSLMKITRQSVCRLRNRGLEKLKKFYM